jgi:hypothetical protein
MVLRTVKSGGCGFIAEVRSSSFRISHFPINHNQKPPKTSKNHPSHSPTSLCNNTMMEVEQPTAAPLDRGGAASLTAEASRLFRVYKTVSSLLSKRGYMVSREMREMTPASFTAKFGEYPSREGLTILVVS